VAGAGDYGQRIPDRTRRWVPDSTAYISRATNRIQNQLDFLVYEVARAKSRTIYRESDSYWINIAGEPVFLKDGKRFLWTSERDGFRHLYLYSLDGAEPQQLTKRRLGR